MLKRIHFINCQQGVISYLPLLAVIAVFGLISFLLISSIGPFNGILSQLFPKPFSHAALNNQIEAEGGTLTAPAVLGSDSNASGGQYIQFGTPTNTTAFQPTAPYYATFTYPWYKNPATDGAYSDWQDASATGGVHNPPTNWFSNYLPDVNTASFSPSTELYSSNDYNVFKWQLTKLAQAKQEVGISSWWGQGHKTDTAFGKTVNDFMNRADNPYPNFRWALYHECEGNICNGTSNPSVSQLVSDLNFIKSNYISQPSMLKINGKPVIFVYSDATDGGSTNTNCSDTTDTSMTHRWFQANSQVGNAFYIVLKVFGGYTTTPCQPDSWHQYSPAGRSDSQGTFSYAVSPGFWRNGDAPRLVRDATAFETAVKAMVSSNAKWKLTETWNEWGEGTSVEPGDEVVPGTGTTPSTLNSTPSQGAFKNTYVDILNRNLPALEQGIGP